MVEEKAKQETSCLLDAGFLHSFLSGPEGGDDMIFRSVA
jgi:hypothetical protein